MPGFLKLLPLQGDKVASVITQGDALGQELLPFQGVWGKTCESSVTYRTFAYQEVKGVKEVKELTRMSCSLKNYAKKTVVLTPQRPQGAITSLTSLNFPTYESSI